MTFFFITIPTLCMIHLASGLTTYTCSSEWTTVQYPLPCELKFECPNGQLEIDHKTCFYGLGQMDTDTNRFTNMTCKLPASYFASKCSGKTDQCEFVCHTNTQCTAFAGSTQWLKTNYFEATCRCLRQTTTTQKASDDIVLPAIYTSSFHQPQSSTPSTALPPATSTTPVQNDPKSLTSKASLFTITTTKPNTPKSTISFLKKDKRDSTKFMNLTLPIFIGIIIGTCIIIAVITAAIGCGIYKCRNTSHPSNKTDDSTCEASNTGTPKVPPRNVHPPAMRLDLTISPDPSYDYIPLANHAKVCETRNKLTTSSTDSYPGQLQPELEGSSSGTVSSVPRRVPDSDNYILGQREQRQVEGRRAASANDGTGSKQGKNNYVSAKQRARHIKKGISVTSTDGSFRVSDINNANTNFVSPSSDISCPSYSATESSG